MMIHLMIQPRAISVPGIRVLACILLTAAGQFWPATGFGREAGERSSIEVTVVDSELQSHLATFFNVNQRVVRTQHGLFITYLKESRPVDGDQPAINEWRLMQSQDDGRSFQIAYAHRRSGGPEVIGKAPEIVADEDGHLYLVTVMDDQHAHVLKFAPGQWSEPVYYRRLRIGSHAPKFSLLFDSVHQRLVLMTAAWLLVIDPQTGQLLDNLRYQMLADGKYAYPQYAFLTLTEQADLIAAWHTARRETNYYYDIHWAVAPATGGLRLWKDALGGEVLGGSRSPIVCDRSGPAPMLNLLDQTSLDGSRTNGLNSLFYKAGYLHFMAGGQVPDGRYEVRYSRIDISDVVAGQRPTLRLGGEQLSCPPIRVLGSDGFFCSAGIDDRSPLYWVSQSDGIIIVLRTDDHGQTWQPHAASSSLAAPGRSLYGVTGARQLVDGWIEALVVDQSHQGPHRLLFFRIPAAGP